MKELLDAFRAIYGGLATDAPKAASELRPCPIRTKPLVAHFRHQETSPCTC